MHADQIEIDPSQVRQLIYQQFPHFAGEPILPLSTAGTVNAIFRIGQHYAARFPLMATSRDALVQEFASMEELISVSPVQTPRPVAIGNPGQGYPQWWSVQTWVDGDIATPGSHSASSAFALDLANLILNLRRADIGDRGFDGGGRGGRLVDDDQWMAECFSKSRHLLDVPRLEAMWASFRDLPPPQRLAMSHRDLTPANLLVAGDRLVGVLDGGGFGPADPALDLVAAWHLLDRERRALFRSTIDADEAEWRRGAAWAFEQAMGLVWYYRQSNPAMSALGESTLARLLEDEASLT